VSEWPHHGAFPHQHGDARGLMERIEAQLRERIEDDPANPQLIQTVRGVGYRFKG